MSANKAAILASTLAGSGAFNVVFCESLAGAALFGAAGFGALASTTGAMAGATLAAAAGFGAATTAGVTLAAALYF